MEIINPFGNRSHAVRAQRVEAHHSLDDFPTPPWATRALMEHIMKPLIVPASEIARSSVWEPAANRGHMARPLTEYFRSVVATDVHDYGAGFPCHDFLLQATPYDDWHPDWVITNPPFRLAERFALRALDVATKGVALLVRLQFLESAGRFHKLFEPHPPLIIAQFVERVPMIKGRLSRSASTATAYAWVLWKKQGTASAPIFTWIAPCRADFDRDGDWPAEERDGVAGDGDPILTLLNQVCRHE